MTEIANCIQTLPNIPEQPLASPATRNKLKRSFMPTPVDVHSDSFLHHRHHGIQGGNELPLSPCAMHHGRTLTPTACWTSLATSCIEPKLATVIDPNWTILSPGSSFCWTATRSGWLLCCWQSASRAVAPLNSQR